jgi:hypothetical protein
MTLPDKLTPETLRGFADLTESKTLARYATAWAADRKYIEALEKALTQVSAGLASAGQTLSNLAHGDLTGDQKQIALNAAANAAHAVVVAEAALRREEETHGHPG